MSRTALTFISTICLDLGLVVGVLAVTALTVHFDGAENGAHH
ncbi:MAG: hypothetical protein ACI4RA_07485 [Kiritimatiellia bacterium]